MLYVIYRLSDNSYQKERFATKERSLGNFTKNFYGHYKLELLVDTTNLRDETKLWIERPSSILKSSFTTYTNQITYFEGGSSAASWKFAFEFTQQFSTEDYVYFVEDDYLHRSASYDVLKEGLDRGDYVSLYDHNDKYISAFSGGNPFVEDDGSTVARIFRTNSAHWRTVDSTTMTFATQVKTLREDEDIWKQWTMNGPHPHDFQAFLELNKKGRSLITPIPGWSTHCEERWASPGIDWSAV